MYINIIDIFTFSYTPPAPKNQRYNKIAKKVREHEALAIYDSSKDNEKVPKSKGGKGVKSSSKIAPKSALPSSGKSTQNTRGSTSRNSTPEAASASSAISKRTGNLYTWQIKVH